MEDMELFLKATKYGLATKGRTLEDYKLLVAGYEKCIQDMGGMTDSAEEWMHDSAELSSLKSSVYASGLKDYFPAKDMSFHDKVLFAIAELVDKVNQ
jgi:hypothetical protein